MIIQPRAPTGTFDTTGATSHEKHRYHNNAAHLLRVNAMVSRHNGDSCTAEKHEAAAEVHSRLAAGHLAAALKPSSEP